MVAGLPQQWNSVLEALSDPAVSEVTANGPDSFFMARGGKRIPMNIVFKNEDEYMESIGTHLAPLVRCTDPWDPHGNLFEGYLSARFRGTKVAGRCTIVLPPACMTAQITITNRVASLTTLEQIASTGSMSTEMFHFMEAAVKSGLTMAFSGGTGGGKDLHDDTIIPTPNGFKRMGDLLPGDVVFDEDGKKTTVKRTYKPMDPRHYEITFSDGTSVRAGMGHLWKVLGLTTTIGREKWISLDESQIDKVERVLASINDRYVSIEVVANISGIDNIRKLESEIQGYSILDSFQNKQYNLRESLSHLVRVSKKRKKICVETPTIRPSLLKTTEEMFMEGLYSNNGRVKYSIEGLSSAVEYNHQNLPIDPYVLGAWLGDGYAESGRVCGADFEVRDEINRRIPITHEFQKNGFYTWSIKDLNSKIRKMDLKNNKHIPDEYIFSSVQQRLDLLSGVVDTDGYVQKNGLITIEMTNKQVVDSLHTIVCSLGFSTTAVKTRVRGYKRDSGEFLRCQDGHRFTFRTDRQIAHVQRKMERISSRLDSAGITQQDRYYRKYIKSIEVVEDDPEEYTCIEVDSPSHMFLFGKNYIPTHNTTLMEACTKLISDDVRIGVAEDTPELHLIQPNVSYLNSVLWKPGKEEKDIASLSWVVQQFQRMRIDKVIVGEVRGKEFADFLVAANSGLGGSMITMHAEDPQNCLTKMTEFAMSGAPGRPVRAINSSIGNTIDLIIQLVKTSDGRRRVSHIQEVTATIGNTEDAKISSSPLYLWDEKTDKFYRPGSMSDAMRKKMMDQGIDVTEFITSPLEARFGAHGSVTGASISSEINPLRQTQRPVPGGVQAVSSGTGVSRSAVRRSIPRSL